MNVWRHSLRRPVTPSTWSASPCIKQWSKHFQPALTHRYTCDAPKAWLRDKGDWHRAERADSRETGIVEHTKETDLGRERHGSHKALDRAGDRPGRARWLQHVRWPGSQVG